MIEDEPGHKAMLELRRRHYPDPWGRPSEGDMALRAAGPDAFFDAVEILADDGRQRLARYASGRHTDEPLLGFWTASDLARRR